jgi:hypothetical protein
MTTSERAYDLISGNSWSDCGDTDTVRADEIRWSDALSNAVVAYEMSDSRGIITCLNEALAVEEEWGCCIDTLRVAEVLGYAFKNRTWTAV